MSTQGVRCMFASSSYWLVRRMRRHRHRAIGVVDAALRLCRRANRVISRPFPRYSLILRPRPEACATTHFFRLLSDTMHSTSSNRQFVHGAPCSTTLQRTLRARQHWHAFDALRLTLFAGRIPGFNPAASALRFGTVVCAVIDSAGEPDDSDRLSISIEPISTVARICNFFVRTRD
jgi:hypothetical protein